MKIRSKVVACFSFAFFGLALGTVSAQAETIRCKAIDVVPTTISAPGVYCLKSNRNTNIATGYAITIDANNVVLDLNGFRLNGSASGNGALTTGIFALNRRNVTVKNGTVEGYYVGIALLGFPSLTEGYVVEDIRAVQNFGQGIEVQGRGATIRNNHVVSTGGSTAFGPNYSGAGIVARGIGARVLNNDVITVIKLGTGSGATTGIAFPDIPTTDGLAVNNRITGTEVGIEIQGSGKFRDNLTSDVVTPFLGGTDAGNNN